MAGDAQRRTFVVVGGENIDATLGTSILQRRPNPEERPRWERVTEFAANLWGQPVTGLFFIIYAICRITVENFREPDSDLIMGITKGQFYSIFMIVIGAITGGLLATRVPRASSAAKT